MASLPRGRADSSAPELDDEAPTSGQQVVTACYGRPRTCIQPAGHFSSGPRGLVAATGTALPQGFEGSGTEPSGSIVDGRGPAPGHVALGGPHTQGDPVGSLNPVASVQSAGGVCSVRGAQALLSEAEWPRGWPAMGPALGGAFRLALEARFGGAPPPHPDLASAAPSPALERSRLPGFANSSAVVVPVRAHPGGGLALLVSLRPGVPDGTCCAVRRCDPRTPREPPELGPFSCPSLPTVAALAGRPCPSLLRPHSRPRCGDKQQATLAPAEPGDRSSWDRTLAEPPAPSAPGERAAAGAGGAQGGLRPAPRKPQMLPEAQLAAAEMMTGATASRPPVTDTSCRPSAARAGPPLQASPPPRRAPSRWSGSPRQPGQLLWPRGLAGREPAGSEVNHPESWVAGAGGGGPGKGNSSGSLDVTGFLEEASEEWAGGAGGSTGAHGGRLGCEAHPGRWREVGARLDGRPSRSFWDTSWKAQEPGLQQLSARVPFAIPAPYTPAAVGPAAGGGSAAPGRGVTQPLTRGRDAPWGPALAAAAASPCPPAVLSVLWLEGGPLVASRVAETPALELLGATGPPEALECQRTQKPFVFRGDAQHDPRWLGDLASVSGTIPPPGPEGSALQVSVCPAKEGAVGAAGARLHRELTRWLLTRLCHGVEVWDRFRASWAGNVSLPDTELWLKIQRLILGADLRFPSQPPAPRGHGVGPSEYRGARRKHSGSTALLPEDDEPPMAGVSSSWRGQPCRNLLGQLTPGPRGAIPSSCSRDFVPVEGAAPAGPGLHEASAPCLFVIADSARPQLGPAVAVGPRCCWGHCSTALCTSRSPQCWGVGLHPAPQAPLPPPARAVRLRMEPPAAEGSSRGHRPLGCGPGLLGTSGQRAVLLRNEAGNPGGLFTALTPQPSPASGSHREAPCDVQPPGKTLAKTKGSSLCVPELTARPAALSTDTGCCWD
uniref:collagen alpha-1(I) chain-like n=1 Tax=Nyctereutes procyonoides TaxID=34880 RepID=UPI0024446FAC|nr:collagen alpha-1(I) chain-like [Nyctereutes procyonoides]